MHHMSDPALQHTSYLYVKCLLIYILQLFSIECIEKVPKSFGILAYSDNEWATCGLLISESNASLSGNASGNLLSLELQPPQHSSTSTEEHIISLKGIHYS